MPVEPSPRYFGLTEVGPKPWPERVYLSPRPASGEHLRTDAS